MFTVIIKYFNLIINSIRYFFNLGKDYQEQLASYARLEEYLNIKEEYNGKLRLKEINSICIKNVNFLYKDKIIFNNFNYEFYKGNIYCIKGKNGSGKSTLINLIIGLLTDEFDGQILYNDLNLKEIDIYNTRKKLIGVVELEPILLNDTILKNITLENESNLCDINNIIEQLNMDSYISSLKEGVNTIIDERNFNISGGEKQKIAIIRALLKHPEVLIFDEPTSALDKASKKSFIKMIERFKNNSIIIIVTHNNDFLEISNHIIDLDNYENI